MPLLDYFSIRPRAYLLLSGFLRRKAGISHFFFFASISSSTSSTAFLKSSAFLLVKTLSGSSSLGASVNTDVDADFLFKLGFLVLFLGRALGLCFFFGFSLWGRGCGFFALGEPALGRSSLPQPTANSAILILSL